MRKQLQYGGLLLFGALFLLACSGSKMNLKDMSAKGMQMAYKPKAGSSAKYKMSMAQEMSQEMMGQEMKFNTTSESMVTLNVDGVSGNTVAYSLKYDSIDMESNIPNTDFNTLKNSLMKANIRIESDAAGNVSKVSGLDAVKDLPTGGSLEAGMKQLFMVFSPNAVKVGDSWSIDREEDVTSTPLEINIKSSTVYTFAGVETHQNRECLKFDYESKSTLTGAGNQNGADLEYDGVGKGKGQIYFDYGSGLIVSSSSTESSDGIVTVPAQGMDIPVMTSETSSRVLVE